MCLLTKYKQPTLNDNSFARMRNLKILQVRRMFLYLYVKIKFRKFQLLNLIDILHAL